MGITLNKERLQAALERAVRQADSGEGLPSEWGERTAHIGDSPSRTYVAVLGSALLARAAYGDRVDPRSIKARSGQRGFSARGSIAVLAKHARDFGYDLGVPGPEPLNNQPWFHADRVDQIRPEEVRQDARAYLRAINSYLRMVDSLTPEEAERALSAFIVSRRRVAEATRRAAQRELAETTLSLTRLAQVAQSFIVTDPEDGRRGQALAAAALDCVFPRVELGSIHDPDPFDVVAFRVATDVVPSPVVQVKQRPVEEETARLLAEAAAEEGASTGLLLALAPGQPALDDDAISNRVADTGVIVLTAASVRQLFRSLAVFSTESPDQIAAKFPSQYERRLREIGVRDESIEEWRELMEDRGADGEARGLRRRG